MGCRPARLIRGTLGVEHEGRGPFRVGGQPAGNRSGSVALPNRNKNRIVEH